MTDCITSRAIRQSRPASAESSNPADTLIQARLHAEPGPLRLNRAVWQFAVTVDGNHLRDGDPLSPGDALLALAEALSNPEAQTVSADAWFRRTIETGQSKPVTDEVWAAAVQLVEAALVLQQYLDMTSF